MSEFEVYFGLGLTHIMDWAGYDHILFVVCVCLGYSLPEWKRIAGLLTAFTIGHSISLAIATLKLLTYNAFYIELLIPITIMLTAFGNLANAKNAPENGGNKTFWPRYALVLLFGMIHGFGFSGFLNSLLGKEADITSPLLAFNLGLEAGQGVIVIVVAVIGFVLVRIFGLKQTNFKSYASVFAAGMAFVLFLQRLQAG